jgi:UDP-N-acetyl-D-mannosaminuronate dehydrogenase
MDRFHKNHLVIGKGEVGTALYEVLSSRYTTDAIDKGETKTETYDVLHICYPWSDKFSDITHAYVGKYLLPGGLLIVHSTVPVGTCRELDAVHSPIRGVHPDLRKGIRTFTKFFGGQRAVDASEYFLDLGIACQVADKQEETEAMKLLDTTYYGWNIVFMKAVAEYCEEHHLDFDIVYTKANKSYNEGYTELGMGHVSRPVLKFIPGPVGGHCIVPNAEILAEDFEPAQIILDANSTY